MDGPATLWRARATRRTFRRQLEARMPLKLHIGCGAFLLPGWINLDQAPRDGAFYLDARRPLPLEDGCVHRIFHEHFLEHLDLNEGLRFLRECIRVLEPGGLMRLSTPDLELTMATYQDRNPAVRRDEAMARHVRITGATASITAAMLFNDKMRGWGHRFLYDEETLRRQLERAGFEAVVRRRFGESEHLELRGLEHHADVPWMRDAEPLIVEARRGGGG